MDSFLGFSRKQITKEEAAETKNEDKLLKQNSNDFFVVLFVICCTAFSFQMIWLLFPLPQKQETIFLLSSFFSQRISCSFLKIVLCVVCCILSFTFSFLLFFFYFFLGFDWKLLLLKNFNLKFDSLCLDFSFCCLVSILEYGMACRALQLKRNNFLVTHNCLSNFPSQPFGR